MSASISSRNGMRPKVGVGVCFTSPKHPNCVLIGIRKGVDGDGLYAFPGGHLEFGEDWISCAEREVLEETGLKLKDAKLGVVVNAVWHEMNFHHVVIIIQAEVESSHQEEPENLEPKKCQGWEWHDWDNFPPKEKIFPTIRILRQKGFHPFQQRQEEIVSV